MRVTSSLWVGAFIRRCYSEGAIATVARRGAEEAGAIFVVVDRLDGTFDIYGPAPQSAFAADGPQDRLFQRLKERQPEPAVAAALERETRFDSDIWVIGVEDRAGRAFLDLV
jgi:hypothetical protein